MIDASVAAGILLMVLPCQLSTAAWGYASSADQLSKVAQATLYNRMLESYSIEKSGWLYFSNAWNGVLDQAWTEPTWGNYLPQYQAAYQIDSIHLNHGGAYRVGAHEMYDQYGALFPKPNVLPLHERDQCSSCVNPMRKTTVPGSAYAPVVAGAGITGSPSSGSYALIVGTGAATVSQVARTDLAGAFWDQYVITGLTPGSALNIYESSSPAWSYPNIYHFLSNYSLAAGDIVEFYCEMKVSSVTGIFNNFEQTVYVMSSADAVVDVLILNINSGSTSLPYVSTDLDGSVLVLCSIRYTLPALAYKWRWVFAAEAQSGGAGNTAATVSFGRCGVRKING